MQFDNVGVVNLSNPGTRATFVNSKEGIEIIAAR